MSSSHRYAATCPKGVERLVADELSALGATSVHEGRAVVLFEGELETAYRACLWSRTASRILLSLAEFPASTADELYAGVKDVAWEDHISEHGTLAVDVVGTSSGLTHTRFTAQKAKDAIVDRIRERRGRRPSVDLDRPDVRVNIRLSRERAFASIDLAGQPLHERGYRTPGEQAGAPLKENLAAAVLLKAGWPQIAAGGGALVDPMCGSGTLLVEGAMIATDQAPGLLRAQWGFAGWLGHDPEVWDPLVAEADERAEAGRSKLPPMLGRDADRSAVALARACVKRAGFGELVRIEHGDLEGFERPSDMTGGLVVTNPPYGVRLGESASLPGLYALLGRRLLDGFEGWQAAILTSDESLARSTGLRSTAAHTLYNGTIETKLYRFDVSRRWTKAEVRRAPEALSSGARMFENRLRKNMRHLAKWARREEVGCYRLYDADLPEYAVAVDLYQGAGADAGKRFAHVSEYAPPATVDAAVAETRLAEALAVVADVLEVPAADVVLKVRARQRGTAQYERQAETGEFIEVAEAGLRFLVNLHDYLDTGLFLDHRPVRGRVRSLAEGRRFCNLFAYTGTASVYAAAGGATAVNSVDISEKYVDWAKRNMALNGFGEGTAGVRYFATDALRWLAEERRRVEAGLADSYGLVFCDPPTFSTSKAMTAANLDVQRDHVALIDDAAALLDADGTLVFSTNLRTFKMDYEALAPLLIDDVTASTIPPDFSRTPRIHHCFLVRKP